MLIGGLIKTSLIDYPDKIAAVVFTQGCNFRCPYCHNPELVKALSEQPVSEKDFFDFLAKRKGKLDAVVISGGEPTLHKDLKKFIKKIKNENFLVKLDTNGTNPNILAELIKEQLIDYIAMDIKGPLGKYSYIVNTNANIKDIQKSMKIIIKSGISYEFRTTVVKNMLGYEDFLELKNYFSNFEQIENYFLQKFIPSKLLDENYMHQTSYNDEEFEKIKSIFTNVCKYITVR